MADIFISYARADRDRIEKLSKALEAEGWSVWWDRHIESGAEFSKDIERELDAAKAVIACWSEEGSNSRWVKDEANIAAEAGKLFAITLDVGLPPIGFRQYHAVDFSGWKGARDALAFQDLSRALKSRLEASASEEGHQPAHSIVAPETKGPEQRRIPHPVAWIGAIAALLLVVVISIFALRGGERDAPITSQSSAIAASEKSIAVLPFQALSNDDSDEYFGKGLAEELLNALAQFPELKVAARTSAFSFEDQNVDLREIGETLGVAHVLEGSVRRSGTRIRVTAQLVRAADGFHLWSETFERELTDIFALQDDIVLEISRNLEVRLGVGGGAGRAEAKSVDPRAFEQYLRGLTLWGVRDQPMNRHDALTAWITATELDPDFADAWSMIALVGARSAPELFDESADIYNVRTEDAFANALRLDPDNARAHAACAAWYSRHDINIDKARFHYDRGMALAPNMAETQYSAAQYKNVVGDISGALTAMDQAIAVDPLNDFLRLQRAPLLIYAGREDEAFAYYDDCRQRRCIQGIFLNMMTAASAMVAGDRDKVLEGLLAFEETVKDFPGTQPIGFDTFRAVAALALDQDGSGAAAAHLRATPLESGFLATTGPQLIKIGDVDPFFELLFQTYREKLVFAQPHSLSHYYPSANQFPERILRHPRYHEFWDLPGMPELAEARRANGQTAGLPLPVEGDDADILGKTIAVLPFEALSNDDSDEYFGKGLAEELINALAQFPELKVAARTSAFSFEGQNIDLREIGEKLGVDHVLEGSVRRSGDRLRVTVQLIRTTDGFHLWSETYERELNDVFAIQDEIVEELTRNLQVRLGVGGGTGRAEARTVDPRAYEHYLRGLYLWGNRDPGNNRQEARRAFILAVETDPDFADAWAAIGLSSVRGSAQMLGENEADFVARTEDAFARALALDPGNARALAGLASWHTQYDIDVDAAQRQIARALASAPNDPIVQYSAGLVAYILGDHEATLRAYDRAVALDPFNGTLQRVRAMMLAGSGRYPEAEAYFEACLQDQCVSPVFNRLLMYNAAILANRDDIIEARYEALIAAAKNAERVSLRAVLAVAAALRGAPDGRDLLDAVIAERAQYSNDWPYMAIGYAHLGEADIALDLLFEAYRRKMIFANPFSFYVMTKSAHQFPEGFLRHPRYHEFWDLPGMPELAEARRANGQTAGLPLPIEGDTE